jgi:predicted nucleotidyltransferase component of viral defense system
MKIPIIKLLKKREYQELSKFQDEVVTTLYQVDSRLILHGGTAIWRCFSGSRFSSDIDAYISSKGELKRLKAGVLSAASAQGMKVEKIKDTGNLIFMAFSSGDTYLKVEMNYVKGHINAIPTRFEKVDGTYTEILTLRPEDLILEKIAAYSDRKFIRDIYDMYILSDYVSDAVKIKKAVLTFTDKIEKPVNEKDLMALIYSGPVPSFNTMVEHIRRRFS